MSSNNKNIYKKYLFNLDYESSKKIDLSNYLYSLQYPEKTLHLSSKQNDLLKIISFYINSLKIQTQSKLLKKHISLIESLQYFNVDNSLKTYHDVLKKRLEENIHLEEKTKTKNKKYTYFCEPIIKDALIPKNINNLIIKILDKDIFLKKKIVDINNSWIDKSNENKKFLKEFKISSTFKKVHSSKLTEKNIMENIDNLWLLKHKSIILSEEELLFLHQVKNNLEKTTKLLFTSSIKSYKIYQSKKKERKKLMLNLKTNENNYQNENNNKTIVKLLKTKYVIEKMLIDNKVSILNHYYIIVSNYQDLERNITGGSQKNCAIEKTSLLTNQKINLAISKKYTGNSILNFPKTYYTINLATYKSFDRARKFVKLEGIYDKAIVYSIDFNHDLIKVIYGIYSNYDEAKKAKDSFPQRLLSHRPMIQKLRRHQKLFLKYNQ